MIAAAVLLITQVLLNPCKFEGVKGSAQCGTYSVWENRLTQKGRKIELSIVVLKAFQPSAKPDPLFFLSGGPGDAPSFNANYFGRVFANVRETRDLVLVDLRGTGRSHALTCPELLKPDSSGVLDSELLSVPAVKACRDRLAREVDLRQYTTENAVDDLDEVRQALGYGQINLYGTSYGTRVAQVYMRRHPASLRTVSLKGIVPPSLASPATHAPASEAAWQGLLTRCRADELCRQNYPTLEADLNTLLQRFKDSPVLDSPPGRDGPTKIKVSAGLFAESFRFFLYAPDAMSQAPKFLRSWVTANPGGPAGEALNTRSLLGGTRLAGGFFLSVSCAEDIPYLPKNATALARRTFAGDYRLRQQMRACRVWPRGTVSKQHRSPTRSDIPTLLLSGEFDPVTPPAGGEEVLRGLSRGLHVIIRNNGHPIGSAADCIGAMIGSFIEKGSAGGLDTACAATVPAVPFAVP